MSIHSAIVLPCFLVLSTITHPSATAQPTVEQQVVVSVERIWDRPEHSAFTDLILYRDHLYCTFREGSGHIPGRNGIIRILRSRDRQNWVSVAVLSEPLVDLRDPKICITPDDRLMVTMGASYYEGSVRKRIESRVAFGDSSGTFTLPTKVILPENIVTNSDWLWRVTWHEGTAYGCVQQPIKTGRGLQLVKSTDGVHYELVKTLDVTGPSETTLRFDETGRMLAMVRRESGSKLGWLGIASPPFTDWKFVETNQRLGGPELRRLPKGIWLAGSRSYVGAAKTVLWFWNIEALRFDPLLTLPSGGDTSYPGFVIDARRDRLYVSYYSSHQDRTAIYLATLRLSAVEDVAIEKHDLLK